tara:strand:- start:1267 stop:2229 length:963 start_codon:yes stop_codon:yes gene_type:complete
MELSIIVVSWNTNSLLQNCLESIFKYTHGIKYELIVIDNGSSDGSVEMVESSFPSVNLIKNKINHGFSKGVNQGIKTANGKNILLLNSDTYILENTFGKMVSAIDKDTNTGAINCRVLYPDGCPQSAYSRFPSLSGVIYEYLSMCKLFNHSKIFYKYDVSQWDYSASKVLMDGLWPGGGCLMIKKEVVEKVGTMDENFGYAYLEDTDLCYRINKAGYSFYYLAEATVYHHHSYSVSKSSQDFKDLLTLNLQRNRYYFFRKHYGTNHLLVLKLLDIVKNTMIGSYFLLSYFFTLNDREESRKKTKLYSKLIAGCFAEHRIE